MTHDPFDISQRLESGAEPAEPKRQAKAKRKPKRATGPGWWAFMCSFIDASLAVVSPAAAACWLAMFRFSRNHEVQIGQAQLAEITGLSARHVKRCIAELIAADLVRIKKRGRRNVGTTIYQVRSRGHRRPAEANLQGDTGVPPQGDTYVPYHMRSGDGSAAGGGLPSAMLNGHRA